MATLVLEPLLDKWLREQREKSRSCYYDEVWDGVYVVTPFFDNEHQELKFDLHQTLERAVGETDKVLCGGVISDRETDYTENFRLPDTSVVLHDGAARLSQTHCFGGPDFLVEIVTPNDRTLDKMPFFASVGVKEVLVVDRKPWSLSLFRLTSGQFQPVGSVTPDDAETLRSSVVPVSFRLMPGTPRPRILVAHHDGIQSWTV